MKRLDIIGEIEISSVMEYWKTGIDANCHV